MTRPEHIVVVGGGIIGASSLFYLAKHPQRRSTRLTLIEASSQLAPGASGKSGGFLALDWHGHATASLAELSYKLHAELAQKADGASKWGYRHVEVSVERHPNSSGELIF